MCVSPLDCWEEFIFNYGETFNRYVTSATEYVEFTPNYKKSKMVVIWKRTGRHNSRGTVQDSEWNMRTLTQSDNGYYNARRKDKSVLRRWKITVEGDGTSAACESFKVLGLKVSCNLLFLIHSSL